MWGFGAASSTQRLSVCAYNLRQKIEPDPSLPRLLLTERGGYRLDLRAGMGRHDIALSDADDRRIFGEAFRSEGGI